MEPYIEIVSAVRKLELNLFAEPIVIDPGAGSVGSLKDVDLDGEVRVVLKPKTRRERGIRTRSSRAARR